MGFSFLPSQAYARLLCKASPECGKHLSCSGTCYDIAGTITTAPDKDKMQILWLEREVYVKDSCSKHFHHSHKPKSKQLFFKYLIHRGMNRYHIATLQGS